MGRRGTESEFELTTIERLERLGYDYRHGEELERGREEVVLRGRLRAALERLNPGLPATALQEAERRFARPQGADTLRRNMAFHLDLTRGIELPYEDSKGERRVAHVHAVDWQRPESNDFLVVNQLAVRGQNDRRTDLVVFVNGLPLVLFELKNPYDEHPTVDGAVNQLANYRWEIAPLFEFNALTVASDGVETLHGMWTASREWFAPWRSIDGHSVEPKTTGSMKALVEGLLPKERLLAYVRNFVLFEVAADKITKKGAKYHQFFAVRLAVEKTLETMRAGPERRIGVIWHTTGSGKSLSMVFLVGILRRRPELENPSFVIQVDRNDLDDQLHDQFVGARALVGDVKHADNTEQLRELLRTQGGEIILTTIEKFRLQGNGGRSETRHPVLSERANIIVIADEAHRSQYGFLKGFARYLNQALPNARRIGFTGTPVSFSGADTIEVFGDYIHVYDMQQSRDDGATVPIYYAPRQVKLHLAQADVDAALEEITKGAELGELERKKSRWAALAAAAGAKDRLDALARDLLQHFTARTATLDGKAMIVCMTRENCVRLYDALRALPGCPEVKVVMTGDLGKDPEEWAKAGHLTTKPTRDAIKKRMVDPTDPLKLVIVCDMWLTGTDIPCLHTLYVDKPMKGHNMIQAISRVNRVFADKPHGLIVDYIGIADELREATQTYTQGGGRGEPAPDVEREAKPVFLQCVEAVRALLPDGIEYGAWRSLSGIDLEDRYALVFGHLTADDARRDEFLQAELRLTHAYLLVKHLDDCQSFADEIIFYQRARNQLAKSLPGTRTPRDIERAVKDLIDDSVGSAGVVDIFTVAGIERADVSILDDRFLQTLKHKPLENLRVQLLAKLVRDEIVRRMQQNVAKAKSFRELLEQTLQRYHNKLIDAAAVIRAMIQMRQEWERDERRAVELGLQPEELAFYDAVAVSGERLYDDAFLCDLVHEVVRSIKRNLKVDWTEPHRDDVKAAVRAAVKLILTRKGVREEDFDRFVAQIMAQAEALYAEWPRAA